MRQSLAGLTTIFDYAAHFSKIARKLILELTLRLDNGLLPPLQSGGTGGPLVPTLRVRLPTRVRRSPIGEGSLKESLVETLDLRIEED